ncbi:MAG: DUF2431 domain-containing protein, partial [Rickettsia endosymbiont of Ixodes persulcatus]|nr:DUF2431 domain-containing protein [Rickettsia endosymbiont of Ixodes persulcatus]
TKYNFIPRINSGDSLLVGEGNLSFSVSLMKKLQQLPRCITSTYEDYNDLKQFLKKLIIDWGKFSLEDKYRKTRLSSLNTLKLLTIMA